ncbi:MAG: FAD-dependent oxidoreductase, partial [Pseudomonadota bacterium]
MAYDYDLFVIGGGSGGVRAARVAAAEGAKVALAEESRMGGTCVIRGCVPKKLMVYASSYRETFKAGAAYGWDVTAGEFDWSKFQTRLTGELDRLEQVYRKLLNGSDVEIFDSRAKVSGKNEVTLADGTTKTAKTILVAVGGWPVVPDLPNAHLGITSNEIFHLEELPKRILIVGGGYIACEFACILNGLGVDVTLYYRGAQILRGFDDEARGLVAEAMRDSGIDIHTGTNILEMGPAGSDHSGSQPTASDASMGPDAKQSQELLREDGATDGPIWVKSTTGREGEYDQVLFATGRAPNTSRLGLEDMGVELARSGAIKVDDYSKTAVYSIYAIG